MQMTLETGEIGRQANGAVTLTYGDTVNAQDLSSDLTAVQQLHGFVLQQEKSYENSRLDCRF